MSKPMTFRPSDVAINAIKEAVSSGRCKTATEAMEKAILAYSVPLDMTYISFEATPSIISETVGTAQRIVELGMCIRVTPAMNTGQDRRITLEGNVGSAPELAALITKILSFQKISNLTIQHRQGSGLIQA